MLISKDEEIEFLSKEILTLKGIIKDHIRDKKVLGELKSENKVLKQEIERLKLGLTEFKEKLLADSNAERSQKGKKSESFISNNSNPNNSKVSSNAPTSTNQKQPNLFNITKIIGGGVPRNLFSHIYLTDKEKK